MDVKNTGSRAGKDVVEVFAQSPYTDYDKANNIEKASVELVGYAKTSELAPGASETVTVTFDQEQLKSYDYTTAKTYILDAGDYYITAAKNAHDAVNNILAVKGKTVEDGMTAEGNPALVATYTPSNGTVDTTTYANDTTTGVAITNLFDDANGGLQYLSRQDWVGTWPTTDGEVSDQIDRAFADGCATRILRIEDRKLISFDGTLTDWENKQREVQSAKKMDRVFLELRLAEVISRLSTPNCQNKEELEKEFKRLVTQKNEL